ncbi:MAG: hypothetical protein NXI09_13120 [Bacteroidetes bacterium]|nr:hypothetical protein [Bacteroidota bacterium]
MKRIYLSCLFFCFSLSLLAQLQIVDRIELPYGEKEYDEIFFEPIGKDGILQFAMAFHKNEDLLKVRVQHYDTSLSLLEENHFAVDIENYRYTSREFINGELHLTLMDGDEYLRYVVYNPLTKDTITFNYQAPKENEFLIGQFHNNKFYIVERVDDRVGSINISTYDFTTKQWFRRPFKPLNVDIDKLEVERLYFPESNFGQTESLFIKVSIKIKRKFYVNHLYQLHEDGILDEYILSNKEMEQVRNITIIERENSPNLDIIGTYGEEGLQYGIFSGEINRRGFEPKSRYGFGEGFDSLVVDTTGFFGYFNKRAKRKARKKGEEFKRAMSTTSHPVIRLKDGGFLWVAEVYHATYVQVPVYSANGVSYRNQFDGYQTTAGLVMRFNAEGQKIWDRNFLVYPLVKPFRVRRFLNIDLQEDHINFVYQYGRGLSERTYSFEGELLHESDKMPLVLSPDEKARYSSRVNTESWYDQYLVTYGYQKIKNKENRKKSRRIYSINKLIIEK